MELAVFIPHFLLRICRLLGSLFAVCSRALAGTIVRLNTSLRLGLLLLVHVQRKQPLREVVHGGWPRLLISRASPTPWVPRPSRALCEGRESGLFAATRGRFKPPALETKSPSTPDSLARVRLRPRIETIAAPAPFLGRAHQPPLHRIAVHIPQLFHPLLRRPQVEVVETSLPERRTQNGISQ